MVINFWFFGIIIAILMFAAWKFNFVYVQDDFESKFSFFFYFREYDYYFFISLTNNYSCTPAFIVSMVSAWFWCIGGCLRRVNVTGAVEKIRGRQIILYTLFLYNYIFIFELYLKQFARDFFRSGFIYRKFMVPVVDNFCLYYCDLGDYCSEILNLKFTYIKAIIVADEYRLYKIIIVI